jgi:diacylglycerol kinase (ATP)
MQRAPTSLVASFRYAGAGLAHLLRTQRNARIELGIGTVAVALGMWLGLTPPEWGVLAVTIALVLILEGLNTALELAVDLASPEQHPHAKAAKDMSAGMVLVAALASIAVGAALFLPRLLR